MLAKVLANHESLDPVLPGPGGGMPAVGPLSGRMYLPRGLVAPARLAAGELFDRIASSRDLRRALFREAALRAVALAEARRFDETLGEALASWSEVATALGTTDAAASPELDAHPQLRIFSAMWRAPTQSGSTTGIAGEVSSRLPGSSFDETAKALPVLSYGLRLAQETADEEARNRLLGEAVNDALVVLGLDDGQRLLQALNADRAMIDGLADAIAELATMSHSRLEWYAESKTGAFERSGPTLRELAAASVLSGGGFAGLLRAAGLDEDPSGQADAVMAVSALATFGVVLRGPIEALIRDGEFAGALAGDYAVRELVILHNRLSAEASASMYNMLWQDRWAGASNPGSTSGRLGLTATEWIEGGGATEEEYKEEVAWRVARVRNNATFTAKLSETLWKIRGLYARPPGRASAFASSTGGTGPSGLFSPGPMEFAWVPPGEFRIDSTKLEADGGELPVEHVRISQGFWLGQHEVTQEQWLAVMGTTPSEFSDCGQCPVESVSREEVQEFIRRLNELQSERGMAYLYRLPTEAEWEYAARAAGTSGGGFAQDLDAVAWHGGNSGGRSHPVGQKAPNALGLHDMLGNVREWVHDWYGPNPGSTNMVWAGSGEGPQWGVRGGSWFHDSSRAQQAPDQIRSSSGYRSGQQGFRLVRTGPADEFAGILDRSRRAQSATIEIDSETAACESDEVWKKACYHRKDFNPGAGESGNVEVDLRLPRSFLEGTFQWHLGWCRRTIDLGLCFGRYDKEGNVGQLSPVFHPERFSTPLPDPGETIWVVAEVRKCDDWVGCSWEDGEQPG